MMLLGLEFVLCGFNQEPVHGGINPAIGITNSVGRLTRNVVRHDAIDNGRDASDLLGYGINILASAELIRELLQAERNSHPVWYL